MLRDFLVSWTKEWLISGFLMLANQESTSARVFSSHGTWRILNALSIANLSKFSLRYHFHRGSLAWASSFIWETSTTSHNPFYKIMHTLFLWLLDDPPVNITHARSGFEGTGVISGRKWPSKFSFLWKTLRTLITQWTISSISRRDLVDKTLVSGVGLSEQL